MLPVRLCDLRPRFRVKQGIGTKLRAIARNGRVLLCADRPLDRLAGQIAQLRLQTWHRSILAGDPPQPYGILVCIRGWEPGEVSAPIFDMRLRPCGEANGNLRLEVGGCSVLDFVAEG